MESAECPYCKEEIKADAMICKHCHQRLFRSREERVMAAIWERIRIATGAQFAVASYSITEIATPSRSKCRALCYGRFRHEPAGLHQCFNECDALEAITAVGERLFGDLMVTFADIVWEGGDIDPLPFEKSVRERFSRLPKP